MSRVQVPFHAVGTVDHQIDVEVTYQIIGLFSEGLYSTPYKALEELVSNSFDADADKVHVVVPADLADPSAAIVVIDNGTGMDAEGLRIHWIVGDSVKKANRDTALGRKAIGKFGIGKLAAYVLGDRLTHITRVGDDYFATTMDFRKIPQTANVDDDAGAGAGAGAGDTADLDSAVRQSEANDDAQRGRSPVQLDLRLLTEEDAREALAAWLSEGDGRKDVRLFGPDSAPSWTVAIISDLKPMAQEISQKMLLRVLRTAMPLRDDFALYLNNKEVPSWKVNAKRIGQWVVGKDLIDLPKPAPSELEGSTNQDIDDSQYAHWYAIDKLLGPITGYLEIYEDPVDTGKSNLIGRSNGFFVYVNGRLINGDDAGFGIDRNTLRHGTFSRFRFVVNIDRLDEELRSSRENLRQGPQVIRAREILQGAFNFARSKLDAHQVDTSSGRQASQRLADSPASLSERPILRMILEAFEGVVTARHLTLPPASQFGDVDALRAHVESRIEEGLGVVGDIVYADLGVHQPIAVLDAASGVLSINLEHPFVAHFADEFGNARRNLPLQLFAMSEILLEAHLYGSGADRDEVATVLDERDELLRHLARSRGTQNSLTIAQDLVQAASSKKELEDAVVAAFNQLGFDAVPRGGRDDSDGIAEAPLPGLDTVARHYRVSLEAKSKERQGAKVTKKGVEVSTIARHRDENRCDHAVVVGPVFQTGSQDTGALIREIDSDRTNTGKTITLITIEDLARLVRIAPIKRISLVELRELFRTARTPAESAAWIDARIALEPEPAKYRDILETVWSEQQADGDYSVTYEALRTALRLTRNILMSDADIRNDCIALARMAPDLFYARDDSVELNIKPEKVLDTIRDYVDEETKVGT